MLAQKPVSGSNLFPVPASSEAGFSAPLQSLPAVFFAKCPRMDVVLLSNEFDVSSNSLSGAVHGCIAPDGGYLPPPVPLVKNVHPCTFFSDGIHVHYLTMGSSTEMRCVQHAG